MGGHQVLTSWWEVAWIHSLNRQGLGLSADVLHAEHGMPEGRVVRECVSGEQRRRGLKDGGQGSGENRYSSSHVSMHQLCSDQSRTHSG